MAIVMLTTFSEVDVSSLFFFITNGDVLLS